MPGISSIFGSMSSLNENHQGTTAINTIAQTAANAIASTTDKAAADISEDRIELSTRAQKIQQLKEEFFPAGYRSVEITPAFIERLHEYGFLSAEEAERLSPSTLSTHDSATDKATDKVEELSQFILHLSTTLKNTDPGNSLITTLTKADGILNNLDESHSATMRADIKSVINALAQYARSDEAQAMSDDDKASLRNLEIAMRIADKLNQSSNAADQINSYLSLLQAKR